MLRSSMPAARAQRGASLLEVLIAVLILAVGMLGMAALQSVTLRNSNSSSGRSQAVIQIYSVLDTLRLNRTVAEAGGYNVTAWKCGSGTATGTDTTDYSVFNGWLGQLQTSLGDPQACGLIDCQRDASGYVNCRVGVQWNDSRATGGEEKLNFITMSRL